MLHFLRHSSVHQSSTDHLPHSNFQHVAWKFVFFWCVFSILSFCHAGAMPDISHSDVTSWVPTGMEAWRLEQPGFTHSSRLLAHRSFIFPQSVSCRWCDLGVHPPRMRGVQETQHRDVWLFRQMVGILLWQHRIRNSMRTACSKISQSVILVFLCILILEDSMKQQQYIYIYTYRWEVKMSHARNESIRQHMCKWRKRPGKLWILWNCPACESWCLSTVHCSCHFWCYDFCLLPNGWLRGKRMAKLTFPLQRILEYLDRIMAGLNWIVLGVFCLSDYTKPHQDSKDKWGFR